MTEFIDQKLHDKVGAIISDLQNSGFDPDEGLSILCMCLATGFCALEVPRERAIKQFSNFVELVYRVVESEEQA